MKFSRASARRKRHARLRRKIFGSARRPRLMFFRSLHHVYACVIDDEVGRTLVAASTRESEIAEGLGSLTNLEAAARVGRIVAERALAAGIVSVVFDTSGLQYHGRVAALADAAREAKLEF